ncbi:thioredoxin domain-containing protein 15 isoform X1 [Cloeon dipterum]|uniref:thioredoxin domain-containing protein 15 isoform X1 n=1 Tax=Cloeon dipterum TaxID=197152 RepID=UPI00321F9753
MQLYSLAVLSVALCLLHASSGESSPSLEQIDNANLLPLAENEAAAIVEEGEVVSTSNPDASVNEQPVGEAIVDSTDVDKNVSVSNSSTISVVCRRYESEEPVPVELINGTGLLSILESEANVTSRRVAGRCVGLLFYAGWCPFSCFAAPYFNALPRTFPAIKFAAIDSMKHYSWNTQFGIVGVPTFLLFHNGRPVARFNETDYNLKMFAKFIQKWTGIEPQGMLSVFSADFNGPLPNVPEHEMDHWLIVSWVFVALCAIYFVLQSALWSNLVEGVKNVWREADEVHEHAD